MRRFLTVLLFAMTAGCNEHQLPTAPQPIPSLPPVSYEVWIGGAAYDTSNRCLSGVEVVVVDGGPNAKAVTDCRNGFYSYVIQGMREGAVVNIRAARVGYVTQQRQVTLHGDLEGWVAVSFVLESE